MQRKIICMCISGLIEQTARMTPTFSEAMNVFMPVRKSIESLRDEVITYRGWPAFIDWTGQISRIDQALLGWVDCWERLAPDLEQKAVRNMQRKLQNGVPITEDEIDACLSALDRQISRFMVTPVGSIASHTTTELISISMDQLGLKDAA